MNFNSYIDYVNIFPHHILFGTKIRYRTSDDDRGIVSAAEPDAENTVHVKDVRDSVTKLFERLREVVAAKSAVAVLFVRFEEGMDVAHIAQIVENMSNFLSARS